MAMRPAVLRVPPKPVATALPVLEMRFWPHKRRNRPPSEAAGCGTGALNTSPHRGQPARLPLILIHMLGRGHAIQIGAFNPMNHSNSPSRLSIVPTLALLVALGITMSGQEAPMQNGASEQREASARNGVLRQNIEDWILQGRGIPADWSHRHVVFSNPAVTEEEAFANGTHDHWL